MCALTVVVIFSKKQQRLTVEILIISTQSMSNFFNNNLFQRKKRSCQVSKTALLRYTCNWSIAARDQRIANQTHSGMLAVVILFENVTSKAEVSNFHDVVVRN